MTQLAVDTIAVRLADEGVPLQAIARATNTPSSQLRERLSAAKLAGHLLELPRDDWPPGFPRDQRALQLSRMVTQNPVAIHLTMQRIFKLTATEVNLLMLLIQSADVSRDRIDMVPRTIDVHICHIRRRLALFRVRIATLWGYGYRLSSVDRRKVMDLILTNVAEPA